MTGLPAGTVTFLFTDIEGSTALLQHLGDQRYATSLAEHHEILCAAFEAGGGRVVDARPSANWWRPSQRAIAPPPGGRTFFH